MLNPHKTILLFKTLILSGFKNHKPAERLFFQLTLVGGKILLINYYDAKMSNSRGSAQGRGKKQL